MSSDPGYQVTPPAPRPSAAREDASAMVPADLQLQSSIWWTRGQLAVVALEALVVLGLLFVMNVLQRDYIAMLWQTPMGLRMLIMAVLLLLVNFAVFLGLCLLFNYTMPAGDDSKRGRRTAAHWVLGLLLFLFCYLPIVFVILVGPAVISIQESLTR
jgi:hypothetical protein